MAFGWMMTNFPVVGPLLASPWGRRNAPPQPPSSYPPSQAEGTPFSVL